MWIEETKNGKYKAVERYTDYLTGKQKKVSVTMEKNTAGSRKVARKALEERINAVSDTSAKKEYTLKELVTEYRAAQKGKIKESTYRRNYHVSNTLMKILGEDTLISRLNAKYVKSSLRSTKDEPGTLNERLIRFKALIRWGYKNDYIQDISFLEKLEPFPDMSHREKIQDKFLESEELKSLIAAMPMDIWRYVTEFLALSGLRIGELAALNDSDIDFDERVLHIAKTYDANNEITTTTKTLTSTRDVFMQDELLAVVKKMRALMLRQKLMHGYKDSGLFLNDCEGGHIKYYAYRKYLKEKAIKAIGRPITPHTLRHTHASLLLEQGVGIDAISRRLGHEDSKITKEIYLHITDKLKERDNKQIVDIKII